MSDPTSNLPAGRFLDPRKPTRTLKILKAPHSYDGSSYYRMWLPGAHLTNNSHHIVGFYRPGGPIIGPHDVDEAEIDVLVYQRPAGREGARMLERLCGQVKLVYEVDDNMLQVDSSGLPHLDDEQVRESIRRCVRMCDMVTVTNEHLAEVYRPYNDNIHVLPNFVKAGLLNLNRPKRDKVVIGWAGGTTHLWDMMTVADPLRQVLDTNDVEMHWVGFDFSPLVRQQGRWSAWQKDVGDYYKNIDFDIAIAPSADRVFNAGKTWIRALEMGALGIPIVAANRLPYSDYVIDGKTGYLVNTDADWRRRLNELIHDEDARRELGANAKAQAAEHTIEAGWRLWEAAYEDVAAR